MRELEAWRCGVKLRALELTRVKLLIALDLSHHICKKGIVLFTLWDSCEDKMRSYIKVLASGPGTV